MTIPFDLEKAKAGAPFYSRLSAQTMHDHRRFIGVRENGDIVYEVKNNPGGYRLTWVSPNQLAMVPQKKTVKGYLLRVKDDPEAKPFFATERVRDVLDDEIYDLLQEFEVEYEDNR